MLVWVTVVVAVVLWVGLIYFLLRYMRDSNAHGREEDLVFKMHAAPWSDTHVESLLRQAPRSPSLLRQYVAIAMDRQDWDEAERRVALFRSRAPREALAWISAADLLRRRGRNAEARALVEKGARKLRRQPEILLAAAREAAWAREWQEAAARFARLRGVAPGRCESYAEGAEVMLETGDVAAAATLLEKGKRRLPEEWRLWPAAARIAERRGDMPAALRNWHELRERFPGEAEGYLDGAAALERAGENEAARQVLQLGCDYLPGNKNVRAALERISPPPTEQPAAGA